MATDPYQVLGVSSKATSTEIKAAYRALVKKHHPDAGGDSKAILALNAAWAVLGDVEHRRAYDHKQSQSSSFRQEAKTRGSRNARASAAAKATQGRTKAEESSLLQWVNEVYFPIDRLLSQIINPFPAKLKELSADPYDDILMESFCNYLEKSQKRIARIKQLYQALPTPNTAQSFGLNLYHCLSQVEDSINELERYTMGYVDNYLHDGREMLREAKRRRLQLKKEQRRLTIS